MLAASETLKQIGAAVNEMIVSHAFRLKWNSLDVSLSVKNKC